MTAGDQSGTMRAARSIYAGNVVLGGAAMALGAHDALLAVEISQRLVAVILLVSGMALAGGMIAHLIWDAKDAALLCAMIGTLPGMVLTGVQLSFFGYSRRLGFWVGAILLPAVAGAILLVQGARLTYLRSLASASLGAALLGLLPSLAGSAYRPLQPEFVDAELTASVVAERPSRHGPMAVVDLTLRIKNNSDKRLVILGSVYSVYGIKSRPRGNGGDAEWAFPRELQAQGSSGRFEKPLRAVLTESGYSLYSPGAVLEPRQHDVESVPTLLPRRMFNTSFAAASVLTANADRVRLGTQSEDVSKQRWQLPLDCISDRRAT